MFNLVMVVVYLALGVLLRGRLRSSTLNQFALNLSLPALALRNMHHVQAIQWVPVLSVWLVYAGAAGGMAAVGRWRGWDRSTVACLTLTAGLSNTSFVGFPLLEAFLGRDSLQVGVQIDQLGSFLLLSSLGVLTAAQASGNSVPLKEILLRILKFAPLYAAALGLLLRPWAWPPAVEEALSHLGYTLSPLTLVSVGTQLRWPRVELWSKLAWGLSYKLLLAPAIILLYLGVTGQNGLTARTTLAEAGMAPMATGALLAIEYGLAPELAGAMLSVGVPLSLATVWLWCAGSVRL